MKAATTLTFARRCRPRLKRRASLVWLVILLCELGTACSKDPAARSAPPTAPTEAEIVRVAGSGSVYPLARILARQFERTNPGYRVVFLPPGHSRGGIAAVKDGTVDVGLLSRPVTAKEARGDTTYLHLAHDILVFGTHRGVGIKGLSRQQLLDIYAGKIVNWKEVGGHDAPIVVLDRPEYTSAKIVMRQELFGPSFVVSRPALVVDGARDVATSLVEIENSIGYLSLGDTILEAPGVAILRVDGVEPTLNNFRQGLYTLTRPFGFLIGAQPKKGTMLFVQSISGDDARKSMELHGFPPIGMDLKIAVLPEQNLLAQEERYGPLMEYLGRQMGLQMTVRLELLPSYGAVIEEFKAKRVDAAFLGSLVFALAHAQAGVEPLARPEKDGVSEYRGLIVTRKDSGIRGWRDLKGRSFGLVDKSTTAGYVFPLLYLREHGIKRPEDFLGPIVYTGSHDLVFTKVYKGELDAGAAKDLILDKLAKAIPEIKSELRVLATSPAVPNNAFVLNAHLDFPCFHCHSLVPTERSAPGADVPRGPAELKAFLKRLLLTLHESAEGRLVLDALGADRFVETNLDDLEVVNRILRDAGFDPKTYEP